MLSTFHVFAGAAVGVATGNPLTAFLAGAVSHHFTDLLPHWDPGSFYAPQPGPEDLRGRGLWVAVGDNIVAVGVIIWLGQRFGAQYDPRILVSGAIGGIFPDLWHHIPWWKRWTRRQPVTREWFRLHKLLHWTVPARMWALGVATQIGVAAASWWFLTIYR